MVFGEIMGEGCFWHDNLKVVYQTVVIDSDNEDWIDCLHVAEEV